MNTDCAFDFTAIEPTDDLDEARVSIVLARLLLVDEHMGAYPDWQAAERCRLLACLNKLGWRAAMHRAMWELFRPGVRRN